MRERARPAGWARRWHPNILSLGDRGFTRPMWGEGRFEIYEFGDTHVVVALLDLPPFKIGPMSEDGVQELRYRTEPMTYAQVGKLLRESLEAGHGLA